MPAHSSNVTSMRPMTCNVYVYESTFVSPNEDGGKHLIMRRKCGVLLEAQASTSYFTASMEMTWMALSLVFTIPVTSALALMAACAAEAGVPFENQGSRPSSDGKLI
jgi:hypothetical protein